MDTINVAIKKGNLVVSVLVFGTNVSDDEIQSFAVLHGGDSFIKLAFNEYVVDGAIIANEKPAEDWTWSDEAHNWVPPISVHDEQSSGENSNASASGE